MKQLTQKIRDGNMRIIETPVPDLKSGRVLVRNIYSLISAGTERGKVVTARKDYIGKAKEKPQQVKQVVDTLRSQGAVQTYRAVMKKLDAYSPLGYSCVGEVIDLAPDVGEFQVGDIVACGGATASHAEVISVPKQLAVRIAQSSKLKAESPLIMAAYNTLGAIAMQGVRQADLRLGENCAVVGMGLLGQLTAILLKASGVRVIGIDIDPAMVEMGREHCLDLGIERNDPGITSKIAEFTGGIGCDGVIITAASSSLDPINFAGEISRKKGTVVVVGAVPTGFDRDPHFYKKELTVKMSCSYGPGRYDPEYEEKGRDYPVGYVRWTEKRNMQAFQALIASGKIDIGYLTTHVFKLEDAPKAYDMIVERSEPFIGILIEYDRKNKFIEVPVFVNAQSAIRNPQPVVIGFIGAGSYAQSYLLPNIPKSEDIVLKGVMTSTSTGSRSVADRYGIEFCTGQEDDILQNDEINTVFIATRHDSHGYYVKKALEAGKHVFVEKPLCLTQEELGQIVELLNGGSISPPGGKPAFEGRKSNSPFDDSPIPPFHHSTIPPILMVGYNRRFSPLTRIIKEKMPRGPFAMTYRINAGTIPGDSWVQDPEIGGGRVIGEVCHFVDLLTFINGSLPVSVSAAAMEDPAHHCDTLTVCLRFHNGSVGSIQYFANGSKSLPKEYVEIYAHGVTAVLNDFRELKIYGKGRPYKKKLMSQDKGQKNELRRFVDLILEGGPPLIPTEEIFNASKVTFAILESIRIRKVISVES